MFGFWFFIFFVGDAGCAVDRVSESDFEAAEMQRLRSLCSTPKGVLHLIKDHILLKKDLEVSHKKYAQVKGIAEKLNNTLQLLQEEVLRLRCQLENKSGPSELREFMDFP